MIFREESRSSVAAQQNYRQQIYFLLQQSIGVMAQGQLDTIDGTSLFTKCWNTLAGGRDNTAFKHSQFPTIFPPLLFLSLAFWLCFCCYKEIRQLVDPYARSSPGRYKVTFHYDHCSILYLHLLCGSRRSTAFHRQVFMYGRMTD